MGVSLAAAQHRCCLMRMPLLAGPNVAGIGLGIIQLLVAAYIIISVRRNPSLQRLGKGAGLQLQQQDLSRHGDDGGQESSTAALLKGDSLHDHVESGGGGSAVDGAHAGLAGSISGEGGGVIGRVARMTGGRARVSPSFGAGGSS